MLMRKMPFMMMRNFEGFDNDRKVDNNDENPVQMDCPLSRGAIHFDSQSVTGDIYSMSVVSTE